MIRDAIVKVLGSAQDSLFSDQEGIIELNTIINEITKEDQVNF
jgi:hypothetical protein